MRGWRNARRAGLAAAVALAAAAAWIAQGTEPARAAASNWDGSWFAMKVTQKGLFSEDGRWRTGVDRFPIWLLLETYEAGGPGDADDAFVAEFRTRTDDGGFETLPVRLHVLRTGSNTDDFLVYAGMDANGDVDTGDGLRVTFVGHVKGKRRSDGSLRSATFKGLGGTYVERSQGRTYGGESAVSGKLIDAGKLPFLSKR